MTPVLWGREVPLEGCDPTAVDPADVVPVTWRPLITRSGRLLGTQAALDLDLDLNLNHIADAGGFAA